MKILITGGYGFLGSHIAERFNEEGHDVCIIDNLISGSESNINFKHKAYKINVEDKKCDEIFRINKFDIVIHLATQVDEYKFFETPLIDSKSDLVGLINMLELSSKYKVKKFIYSSCTAIYGNTVEPAISEDTQINPKSVYALNKDICEQYCTKLGALYNLQTICFRISEVYGPRQRVIRGNNNISDFIHCLINNESLNIYGTENQTKDFIYVKDVAEAIYIASESYIDGIYNLSANAGTSILDLLIIFKHFHTIKGVIYKDARCTEGIDKTFDNSKLKKALDWIPLFDMEDGIRQTYDWYKNNSYSIEGKEKNTVRKKKAILKRKPVPYFENIMIFILIELVSRYKEIDLFIGSIDLKIIYIILISISYGLKQAVLAVLFCNILFLRSNSFQGRDIFSLIFDTEFILNISLYIIIGLFVGYMVEKRDRKIEEEKRRNAALEERYEFLKEVYTETINVKNELQNQIVNSEDSFGKIYGVIKELDSLEPQYIFKSAISVLENLLRTQRISIYTVDKIGIYMRLAVKSSSPDFDVKKTIKLDDFMEAKKVLVEGEIYINRELRPDTPLLMAPIMDIDKLIGVIVLDDVQFENMTLYFQNLFKVICNLISTSIVRAYAYENAIASERYYEDTIFLKTQHFMSILDIRKKSKLENKSEFSMLRILALKDDYPYLSQVLSKSIRDTDFAGIGQDGFVYLILNNTSEQDSLLVVKRLINNGVKAELYLGEYMYA